MPTPTREEFTELLQRVNALSNEMAATNRELQIQFDRIAQLQADIDLIRSAWSKLGAEPALTGPTQRGR